MEKRRKKEKVGGIREVRKRASWKKNGGETDEKKSRTNEEKEKMIDKASRNDAVRKICR